MNPRPLLPGIEWVGAIDWDRRLFDDLIPLPEGTSYNAYLVRGRDKTVLFDTVDPAMQPVLAARLERVDRIDYVVAHHAEQDHSGCIPWVLERYPMATCLATKKCRSMLIDELRIPEDRVRGVEDGEQIDLGGKTVRFLAMPWIHWPETMVSFLVEDRVLLTCDLFGSHLATSHPWVADERRVYRSAKVYYATIMMPFRSLIEKHLEKILFLDPAHILPSHGPAYDRPSLILDAYREWISAPPKNLVAVLYASMHGSTRILTEHLVDALSARGLCVRQFDAARSDLGELAIALVDAATLVVGTPTVLTGPHPALVTPAYLAGALKPKIRRLGLYGSYGWGPGRVADVLMSLVGGLQVEVLPPVQCKSLPTDETLAALDGLADAIAAAHREDGLM